MSGPKDIELDISDFDTFPGDDSDSIAIDSWGNEWDSTGDFSDMDFRLVDEE